VNQEPLVAFVQSCAGLYTGRKAVVIHSGGMDSTTLLYLLRSWGYDIVALSFDYGQRHGTELSYAVRTCMKLGIQHQVVDLRSVGPLLSGSALTDDSVPVPHGHYAAETMRATVVPNRNMIMLSIAIGVGVTEKARIVAIGVHAGDHAIYPDCRPVFMRQLNYAALIGNESFVANDFHLEAPFVNRSKADIAWIGDYLGVPWKDTWSCYEGGALHCGKCGTCVERIEAFQLAGVTDPTKYQQ
jgi:7-cyano-7-deazaguanine synthase